MGKNKIEVRLRIERSTYKRLVEKAGHEQLKRGRVISISEIADQLLVLGARAHDLLPLKFEDEDEKHE